mgnify:CR=1 FL=1
MSMERTYIFVRAGRAFTKRHPLCADTFDRFPTIADLYEEQAMRRATRTAAARPDLDGYAAAPLHRQ